MSNTVEINYPIRAYGVTLYLPVRVTPWCSRSTTLHYDVSVYDAATEKWVSPPDIPSARLLLSGIEELSTSDWTSIQEAAEQAKADALESDPDSDWHNRGEAA